MCGICGVVQIGGEPRAVVAPEVLDRMTDAMTHRGPNDRGTQRGPGFAFGARRLMWGSDITRLKGTYAECLRLFKDELDFLSDEDKEWVLGRSIAEVLNWPETA